MDTAFEAREKWEIDKALKEVKHAVEVYSGMNRYEKLHSWHTLIAYISLLEIELKSYHRKEKDGLCV